MVFAIWLLGTLTSVRSAVRIRVERRPMYSTVPVDLAHLQQIADSHGLIEDQRRAGDDVLERLLRRERDGDAADAEPASAGVGSIPKCRSVAISADEDHQQIARIRAPRRASEVAAAALVCEPAGGRIARLRR